MPCSGHVQNRVDPRTVQARESISVEIDAQNMDDLVAEWLNELLFQHAAKVFLPSDYNITVDKTHHSLSAFIQGERFDRDRHYLRTEVRTATYRNLKFNTLPSGKPVCCSTSER
ncbi:MAG TPA: archease [Dehalococcoidia bacterium]|nr:archease [Dehalococcoidia bacterium]